MKKRPLRPWTQAELQRLEKHFPRCSNAAMAALLGRSASSVAKAASRLGLRKLAATRTASARAGALARFEGFCPRCGRGKESSLPIAETEEAGVWSSP
jgi:ribosomal protein S27AE